MKAVIPDGWAVEKSSDFCLRVADGTHDTPKPTEEGYPLITSKNLKGGQILLDGAYNISTADFNAVNKRSKVDQWDVLFSMIGTVGQMALVRHEPNFAIKNIGLFKSRSRDDGMWLYYYLSSPVGQAALDTFLTGTSQQFVGLTDLRKVPVISPSPVAKRKIAAILTAYDDLIETNKRRIALLEKMAEELYREWFVRMRFPGHQDTKFVKGVPEGWAVRPISSFCKEIRAGVKKKDLADDEIYIGLEHIPRKSIAFKEWATADSVVSNKLRFKERDILFSKIRPYLHKVGLAHFSGVCSSDTIVLRPRDQIYEGFLLFTVFSETFIELATTAAKGTKMPRADWAFLEKLELKIPPSKIIEEYQTRFEKIFSLIATLLKANQQATASRDLLLPRLISGKLSVEDLDIQFPPSMREEATKSEPPHA